MRSSMLGVVVVCVMALLVIGCGKEQPAKPAGGAVGGAAGGMNQPAKPAQPAQPVTSGMEQEKNALVQSATEKLNQLKKDIDDMGAKAMAAGAQAETNWNQNVKPELDKAAASAQKALGEAKSAAADKWAVAKDDLNKALDALQSAYDKAKPGSNMSPSTNAGGAQGGNQ